MKHIATTAFALCLLAGTSALAQGDDHHDHSGGGGPAGGAAHDSGGAPHGGAPAGGGAPHTGGPAGGGAPGGAHTPAVVTPSVSHPSGGPSGGTGGQHYFGGGGPSGGQQHSNGGPTGGGPNYGGPNHNYTGGPNYNRGPGGHGGQGGVRPQYSSHNFPRTFRPTQQFHWRGGNWSGPSGYYYRHWSYGQRLPFGWFGPQWYINDYYDYQLPVPPYGYEWVRNGPDALLVDINVGTVVEVVPGVFY